MSVDKMATSAGEGGIFSYLFGKSPQMGTTIGDAPSIQINRESISL
jgi:hypothetical protein